MGTNQYDSSVHDLVMICATKHKSFQAFEVFGELYYTCRKFL